MSDKLGKLIDRRLEGLKTDEVLRARILERVRGKEKKKKISIHVRSKLVLPLAVCIGLLFSAIAVAAVPSLWKSFVHLISPQYEEFAPRVILQEDGSEGDGESENSKVLLEVTNAVTDGKTMILYFQIQDIGGHLGETIDIYDYSINGYTFFNCQQIGFDNSTNTAQYCILASGGEKPEEEIVRMSISALMAEGHRYEDFNTGIQVKELIQEETVGQKAMYRGGGGSRELRERLMEKKEGRMVHVLNTDCFSIPFRNDIDFVNISNVGYLDGYLHIQTKWKESIDNHGDVYLLDGAGNRVPSINMHFEEENVTSGGDKYIEYVYDTSGLNLDTCTLNAFFVEDGELLRGEWVAEFAIHSVEHQFIQVDGQDLAGEIVITPLGIYLHHTQLEGGDIEKITIIEMDGTEKTIAARFTDYNGTTKHLLLVAESPLQVEQLQSVVINGKEIYANSR